MFDTPKFAVLYEVKKRIILCHGNISQRYTKPPTKYTLADNGDILTPDDSLFTCEDLPVHDIKCIDSSIDSGRQYIVLTPELRAILEMPFVAQLNYSEGQIRKWRDAAGIHERNAKTMEAAITTFVELPWYSRVWRALRCEI